MEFTFKMNVQKIEEYLVDLSRLVDIENGTNIYASAILSEGILVHFLNQLHDWKLENLNIYNPTEKAVDLISNDPSIIVQVSSKIDKVKIQKAINAIDNIMYKGYHFIYIYIGRRDKTTKYNKFAKTNYVIFDEKTDIWDFSSIMRQVNNARPDTVQKLLILMEQYFCKKNEFFNQGLLEDENASTSKKSDDCIGYCINFGMNCCRLFEIPKEESSPLREIDNPITYDIVLSSPDASSREKKRFLEEIIRISQNALKPFMTSGRFVKVFADAEYEELFTSREEEARFIEDYYHATGYYFSVLTQKQTEDNMKALFNDIQVGTAIVDICSTCVHVVIKTDINKFKSFLIKISTGDIKKYAGEGYWNDEQIRKIKQIIKAKIGKTFLVRKNKRVYQQKAKVAYIIKDEFKFMDSMGYQTNKEANENHIGFDEYTQYNRSKLFYVDNFKQEVDKKITEMRSKFYGFREGHIILETLFEMLDVQDIIPKDVPNILRSPLAYIFNVVLSGSTKEDHVKYMEKAHDYFTRRLQANVTSPDIKSVKTKSRETYQRHIRAIKNCDLLFVCNGDGYIGEQTRRDIYGATLLTKPIAYWQNPAKNKHTDIDELDYDTDIPHDVFEKLLDQYYPNENVGCIKGCIIGSFRKNYTSIVDVIDQLNEAGIKILSPKKSKVINPGEDFVLLASDDRTKTVYEIQAQVFEHERNSDFVYVWNPDGYIGKTTCYEIGRIIERGTPIFYKEKPVDLPLEVSDDSVLNVEELICRLLRNMPLGS